ncbi:MAG TPA: four helix bundle protein [Pyrinomonadaceae bacterium]|nr:four helix bundle protein [Pyrinomonadaceae bacterium]
MSKITRFEDIESWKKARKLTKDVYTVTAQEKFLRDFGLKDQIRRAAVSIISNIAEGFERGGDKEFLQFLSIAKGSSGEVRAQLYVALDLDYISIAQFDALTQAATEVSQLISGLMKYLRTSNLRGNRYRQED